METESVRIKKRTPGIDYCRILAMIGVIAQHILGQGGVLDSSLPYSGLSFDVEYWVELLLLCSVDIFAIITGYLSFSKATYKTQRLFELIFIVLFYELCISVPFFVKNTVSGVSVIESVKQILCNFTSTYWYIVCYIPILLLQPFTNKFISVMDRRCFRVFLVIMTGTFGLLPSVVHKDIFKTNFGYSFFWLLVCYFIGAYLRKFDIIEKYKKHNKYLWIVLILIPTFLLILNYPAYRITGKVGYFTLYVSPFIIAEAVIIIALLLDRGINYHNAKHEKIVTLVSSLAFDAYIIHCNCFVYDLMGGAFKWLDSLFAPAIPVVLLAVSLVIFVVCIGIAFIRTKIFKITGLYSLIEKLGVKTDSLVNPLIK